MRTHLLQAVPAVATEANGDIGEAANDSSCAPPAAVSRPALLVAIANVDVHRPGKDADEQDDYYLGGYAGI
jgi:hypothetical protein